MNFFNKNCLCSDLPHSPFIAMFFCLSISFEDKILSSTHLKQLTTTRGLDWISWWALKRQSGFQLGWYLMCQFLGTLFPLSGDCHGLANGHESCLLDEINPMIMNNHRTSGKAYKYWANDWMNKTHLICVSGRVLNKAELSWFTWRNARLYWA